MNLLTGLEYEGDMWYYLRDVTGEITALVSLAGEVMCHYEYDAYGNHVVLDSNNTIVTSDTFIGNINPFRYKGYYFDSETSLYYCMSRYYNPEWCRWISPDNLRYLAFDYVEGLNLYCYCLNNPVFYVDPKGGWVIPCPAELFNDIQIFFTKLIQDLISFDMKNTSEQVVIDANYFSFYKGAPVIKHYIKNDAFTSCTIFGIMFINGDDSKLSRGIDTIKHEWGHFVQEKYYGELLYLLYVAYPSIANRNPNIDYFSQPWEYGADVFGGVQGYQDYTIDAHENFIKYHNEIIKKRRTILQWLRRFV